MSAGKDTGKMTWGEAAAGPLAGATCLWQDLDGLHVEPAPPACPPASIMWAWRADSTLFRLRLDADTAFVAMHKAGIAAQATVAWDAGGDGRVAGARGPGAADGGAGAAYEQIVVMADGSGPVTFIRPAQSPHDPDT